MDAVKIMPGKLNRNALKLSGRGNMASSLEGYATLLRETGLKNNAEEMEIRAHMIRVKHVER
jgi:hypothetical protein